MQSKLVTLLKAEGAFIHASVVHLFRKAVPQILLQQNVTRAAIEQVGWAAMKVMDKSYNKEPPAEFLVGAAGCATSCQYPLIRTPLLRT